LRNIFLYLQLIQSVKHTDFHFQNLQHTSTIASASTALRTEFCTGVSFSKFKRTAFMTTNSERLIQLLHQLPKTPTPYVGIATEKLPGNQLNSVSKTRSYLVIGIAIRVAPGIQI
jgi:hypothetical protein